MIDKLLRFFWSETRIARRIHHRRKYPGLHIDDTAAISGSGSLRYGTDASVGRASILVIAEGTTLGLGDRSYVGRYVELAPSRRISIGRAASIQDRCVILGDVDIGAYCTLAYNVYISSGNHVVDWSPALPLKTQDARAPAESHPVTLEEDCWLGNNVFVKAGVRIGRGAVVGANSVVTKDVPPYAVVAGSPARMVRKRLEYAARREIRFDDDDSLAYFHSGFWLLDPELADSRKAGGLVAEGSFSVVLDASGCSRLGVELLAGRGSATEIEYAGQRRTLDPAITSVEFDCAPAAAAHEFRLAGPVPRARIARVWAA